MIPPQGPYEHAKKKKKVRQIHTAGPQSHPRASEISNAVLRAIVFPALGVVPFDAKPGSSCAMYWTGEFDRADVS